MAYLPVQQSDADRSDAVKVEAEQILRYGARVGATEVIPAMFTGTPPTAPQIAPLLNMLATLAIAVERLSQNGTTTFPARVPVYAAPGNLPAPSAAYTGSVAYVTSLSMIAWCNGTHWYTPSASTQIV